LSKWQLTNLTGKGIMNKMLRRALPLLFGLTLSLTVAAEAARPVIDVYKSASCGCCEGWSEHLRKAGFDVRTHDVGDVPGARQRLGMPEKYAACHTAKVGNYLIEGHVPAADIKRLLAEKPKAIGLAVPSMPPGSPGMENPHPVPYETLLVQANGSAIVFARH
jgi:hypothetical protein